MSAGASPPHRLISTSFVSGIAPTNKSGIKNSVLKPRKYLWFLKLPFTSRRIKNKILMEWESVS